VGGLLSGGLDGFIIQNSPSNLPYACPPSSTSYITVNGHTISSDWGGGITVYNSNPLLQNLIIRETFGTGIYIKENSNPVIVNTLIYSNEGIGIQCFNSTPNIYNSKTVQD
jgi:hypothetical protein